MMPKNLSVQPTSIVQLVWGLVGHNIGKWIKIYINTAYVLSQCGIIPPSTSVPSMYFHGVALYHPLHQYRLCTSMVWHYTSLYINTVMYFHGVALYLPLHQYHLCTSTVWHYTSLYINNK